MTKVITPEAPASAPVTQDKQAKAASEATTTTKAAAKVETSKTVAPKKPQMRRNPAPVHEKLTDPLALTFTPRAWVKIVYMRDRGKSEVSGFGISHPDDPFLITDFRLVPQVNTSMFTEFLDNALANYLEDMVIDEKIPPARCIRVWIHTHPSMSPTPSSHDEETFKRVNASSTWGVMCIIADDKEYARLRVNNAEGMSGQKELSVHMDLRTPFEGVTAEDYEAWEQEYCNSVSIGTSPSLVADAGDWRRNVGDGYDPRFHEWNRDDYNPGTADDLDIDGLLDGETVCYMELAEDGWFYVYTNQYWLQYGAEQEVLCEITDSLLDAEDVSHFPPHDWGTIVWSADGTPVMYTKCGDDHFLNEMREPEETVQERLIKDHDERKHSRKRHPSARHSRPGKAD